MDGIINVYKEKGYTSFDVVAKLRGILKIKKIGHTGTLDPDAEGVLPVCIGSATKLCDMLTDRSKEYLAILRLGVETDTQDMTGTVLRTGPVPEDEALVRRTVQSFTGEYDQLPPMYSALKVNGQKLCDLARQGKEVERKPRRVTIHAVTVTETALPLVTMRVHCSKGTYIRTLCKDIGDRLGCGGCMQSLVRTRVSEFTLEEAVTLSEIERFRDEGRLSEWIRPIETVFSGLTSLCVRPEAQRFLDNGNPLRADQTDRKAVPELLRADCETAQGSIPADRKAVPELLRADCETAQGSIPADRKVVSESLPADGEQVRMYHSDGRFCGIYAYHAQSRMFRPVKIFTL